MGFSGLHINGHSGTDQKNRKAFSWVDKNPIKRRKSRDLSTPSIAPNNLKTEEEVREKYIESKVEKFIKYGIKIPLAIISVSIIVFACYFIYSGVITELNNATRNITNSNALMLELERKNALQVLVNEGDRHYKLHEYEDAQYDYTYALKVDTADKNARIGLTKVLLKRCELENKYCDEAAANLKYIKQMNYKISE